jgi:Pyruvate/2-oxoacid:ferredoxin oxidoreductase gamma subunit
MKQFPLGVYKDRSEAMEPQPTHRFEYTTVDVSKKINIPEQEFIGEPGKPLQPRYENPRLKLAGFGGQGVLMLGLMVAQSGMEAGYHVSWIPSYGPEMRGGTANCHVNLSSRRIGSPIVSRPTVLVAMNWPSLEKFESEVSPDGLIIYDSSLISQKPNRDDVEVLAIPATQMADELGNARIANMVILGAYMAHTRCLSKEVVFAALPTVVKRKNLIPLNQQAIEKGMAYIEQKAQTE